MKSDPILPEDFYDFIEKSDLRPIEEKLRLYHLKKSNMEFLPEIAEKKLLIKNYLIDPNIIEYIDAELDKKIVGEHEARKTIFMVANMRNVENLSKATDNLMINALSGAGKDHISEAIFELIPEGEKEELIRTSPKVLAYTRNRKPGRFGHEEGGDKLFLDWKIAGKNIGFDIHLPTWKKVALRLEDNPNTVLNDDAFKVMSSANPNKINKLKVVNKAKVENIEIEGKPSIIMTIAEANPKEELLRRFPVCPLDEGIDQTKEILKRQAEFAKNGKSVDFDPDLIKALALLKRIKVRIPYADKLTSFFCAENVIVRTHFQRFLDYIKSSCSLQQYQRRCEHEYFIAEELDYEIARMMLQKTTSNILMIPLTKIRRTILEVFAKHNLLKKSVDDLAGFAEIEKLNITEEWLRKNLDWLASKTFLIKDKERRVDEAGRIIAKPVYIYSYNKMQQLEIPKYKELDIKVSSIASDSSISSISSISSNTGVNELIELFELKKHRLEYSKSCPKCGSDSTILIKEGTVLLCKTCRHREILPHG